MSSPYAAPNSPIASSKRARVSKDKELRSPSGKPDVRPLDLKVKTDEVIFSPPGGGGVRGSTPRDEDPPSSSASAAAKVKAEDASRAAAEVEENDIEEFDPYIFIKGLPPHASVVIRGKRCLPPRPRSMDKNLKTLTLDLDEVCRVPCRYLVRL